MKNNNDTAFKLALKYVLKNEGGLSENPQDRAGITNFGISLQFLKIVCDKYDFCKNRKLEDVILSLTSDQVEEIYKNEFWNKAPFDKINSIFVCEYIFDMSINHGLEMAIRITQTALWAMDTDLYSTLQRDGILGEKTIDEINCYGVNLLYALRAERAHYFRNIVNNDATKKVFLAGWLRRAYR